MESLLDEASIASSLTAIVRLRSLRTCFVNLPSKWCSALWDLSVAQVPLKVDWKVNENGLPNQRTAFFSWSGYSSVGTKDIKDLKRDNGSDIETLFGKDQLKDMNVIEIDIDYAKLLNISDGMSVSVGFLIDMKNNRTDDVYLSKLDSSVAYVKSVNVEPFSSDDWEILELHANLLEQDILTQIKIIGPEQPFLIRVQGPLSEIFVAPKIRDDNKKVQINPDNSDNNTVNGNGIDDIYKFKTLSSSYLISLFIKLLSKKESIEGYKFSFLDNNNNDNDFKYHKDLENLGKLNILLNEMIQNENKLLNNDIFNEFNFWFKILFDTSRSSILISKNSYLAKKLINSNKLDKNNNEKCGYPVEILQIDITKNSDILYSNDKDTNNENKENNKIENEKESLKSYNCTAYICPYISDDSIILNDLISTKINDTLDIVLIKFIDLISENVDNKINISITKCIKNDNEDNKNIISIKLDNEYIDTSIIDKLKGFIKSYIDKEKYYNIIKETYFINNISSNENIIYKIQNINDDDNNNIISKILVNDDNIIITLLDDKSCISNIKFDCIINKNIIDKSNLLITDKECIKILYKRIKSLSGYIIPTPSFEGILISIFNRCNDIINNNNNNNSIELSDSIKTIPIIKLNENPFITIFGPKKSGKTELVKWILNNYLLLNNPIKIHFVNCSNLEFKSSTKFIKPFFDDLITRCIYYNKSIIIFDDLNKLLPSILSDTPQGQNPENRIRQLSIISSFKKLISLAKTHGIPIICTAPSKESLSNLLDENYIIASKDNVFWIKVPIKAERIDILKYILYQDSDLKLYNYSTDKLNELYFNSINKIIDFDLIGKKTEGFIIGDFVSLISRAKHEMNIRLINNKSKVEINAPINEDFLNALEEYIPVSLIGNKLHESTGNWEDIGGLFEAKRILIETLDWPTKYQRIFNSCPIRLRSGILLYGYPGCGKTLLAMSIAERCGLNFISVKGPEIMNKYIGASEQSIRSLFDRASAAKPCILFFDEFDSIAPRRGHDNTGVTDRIVNQLLTELDGAEGLSGVYVIAATSRPNMIDPALVRPGRLDKSILCPLPNEEERKDILLKLINKGGFKLSLDFNINDIIKNTENYTGADLQGILSLAQLNSIHEKLNNIKLNNNNSIDNNENYVDNNENTIIINKNKNNKINSKLSNKSIILKSIINKINNNKNMANNNENNNNDNKEKDKLILNMNDFNIALKESKPSLSKLDINKFKIDFDKYIGIDDGNNNVGTKTIMG